MRGGGWYDIPCIIVVKLTQGSFYVKFVVFLPKKLEQFKPKNMNAFNYCFVIKKIFSAIGFCKWEILNASYLQIRKNSWNSGFLLGF